MADVRTIRVFIASPGDLAVERRAFKDVIEELNDGFGDGAGVKFEALGWEDTLASTGRRSQGVINREIDRCDARRLGLRPDRVRIRTVGTESQPTDPASMADPGPQLQKVLAFRKSLEESRQVLSHGFANETEFKAEVDRHLRAFAKGELPPANAPRDKVLLPLAVLAEVQKEKAEKELALARAKRGSNPRPRLMNRQSRPPAMKSCSMTWGMFSTCPPSRFPNARFPHSHGAIPCEFPLCGFCSGCCWSCGV